MKQRAKAHLRYGSLRHKLHLSSCSIR